MVWGIKVRFKHKTLPKTNQNAYVHVLPSLKDQKCTMLHQWKHQLSKIELRRVALMWTGTMKNNGISIVVHCSRTSGVGECERSLQIRTDVGQNSGAYSWQSYCAQQSVAPASFFFLFKAQLQTKSSSWSSLPPPLTHFAWCKASPIWWSQLYSTE